MGKSVSGWDLGGREKWREFRGRRVVPANSGALDPNGDFAMLEVLSLLDALECRCRLGYPELVLRVCENPNVGQADRLGYRSHG